MFNRHRDEALNPIRGKLGQAALAVFVGIGLLLSGLPVAAQDQSPPAQAPQGTSQSPDNGKPKQDVPAEAGGPGDNVGPYAIPKKKAEDTPPPPPVTPKKWRTCRTTR